MSITGSQYTACKNIVQLHKLNVMNFKMLMANVSTK